MWPVYCIHHGRTVNIEPGLQHYGITPSCNLALKRRLTGLKLMFKVKPHVLYSILVYIDLDLIVQIDELNLTNIFTDILIVSNVLTDPRSEMD